MTRKDIRDAVIARVGADWVDRNGIQKSTIDDLIFDEYEKMVGDTNILEGQYSGTTDGTNPYLEINESIMLVKGVWYDWTVASDWGTQLVEASILDPNGDYETGDPTSYFIQGMHRVNKQRLYFDNIPESGKTVRAIFYKWPDTLSSDATVMELKKLWGKALKEVVISMVCNMGNDVRENQIKRNLGSANYAAFEESMKVIRAIPKRPLQTTVFYRDI